MHKGDTYSIFSEYYKSPPLVDRYLAESARGVDVVIPIIHTNEMWRANLLSIYREIPVKRLILADGGCTDDSLDVARDFPRVEVLDHRSYTSLGYSLRGLIEATTTDWFVYLHSDVYLPGGWFDAMNAHRDRYDWFECNQRITVMADYLFDTTKVARSYSGSQMGRRAAFANVTPLIDDDFLYRNEDIILARLVERAGGRYGKVGETHHFHQVMYKPSRWHRAIKSVAIVPDIAHDEEVRANRTYAQGIIKYLRPSEVTSDIVESVVAATSRLVELKAVDGEEFLRWVRATSEPWYSLLVPAHFVVKAPVTAQAAGTQSGAHAVDAPNEAQGRLGAAASFRVPRRARIAKRLRQLADVYEAQGAISASLRATRSVLRKVAWKLGSIVRPRG